MAWELLQSGHYLFAANSATLYDDVVPTLEHLRDEGFKLAIVSNWDTPLYPLTERLGIAEYFDAIIASHDARVRSENRIPISSTMRSRQSVFRRKKSSMSEIHTRQMSSGREM